MDDLNNTPLQDNKCVMTFSCNNPKDTECVYFMCMDTSDNCKYADKNNTSNTCACCSAVACANKMIIELKQIGL